MPHNIIIAKNKDGFHFLKRLSNIYFKLTKNNTIIWNINKSSYPRLSKTNKRGKVAFEEIKKYLDNIDDIDDKLIIQICKLSDIDTFDEAFNNINEKMPVLSPSPFIEINNKDLSIHEWINNDIERLSIINNIILNYFIKSQSQSTTIDNLDNIKNTIEFYNLTDIQKLEIIKFITNN